MSTDTLASTSDRNLDDQTFIGSTIEIGGNFLHFESIFYEDGNSQDEFELAHKKASQKIDEYFDILAETLYENPRLQNSIFKCFGNQ